VRDRRRKIIIPAGHARYLRNTAMQLLTASKQDRIGTRPHHHLRTLAKASALQSGRGAVTGDDLERVYQHVDFFRPEGREL